MRNYTNALTVKMNVTEEKTGKQNLCYYTILTNFTNEEDMDKLVKGYGNVSQLDYINDMSLIVKNPSISE